MRTQHLQAEADRQLAEQQEKETRALKAVQRAQKLLATQASMARPASSSGAAEGSNSRGSSAASSSRASTAASGAAAGGVVLDAAELQQDVQLAEVRQVTRTMLQELSTIAQQHPGECESVVTGADGVLLASCHIPAHPESVARCSYLLGHCLNFMQQRCMLP